MYKQDICVIKVMYRLLLLLLYLFNGLFPGHLGNPAPER